MTTRRITARFMGADRSLGYRRGRIYELVVRPHASFEIVVMRLDGTGWCPYQSRAAFEMNWVVLSGDPFVSGEGNHLTRLP